MSSKNNNGSTGSSEGRRYHYRNSGSLPTQHTTCNLTGSNNVNIIIPYTSVFSTADKRTSGGGSRRSLAGAARYRLKKSGALYKIPLHNARKDDIRLNAAITSAAIELTENNWLYDMPGPHNFNSHSAAPAPHSTRGRAL